MIRTVNECNKKYVLGIFVDFQGAFDNLEWAGVIDKLQKLECKELNVWKSFFTDRRVCAVGVNEVVWKNVSKGCPQSSICGPFVWNIIMGDLLNELESVGCNVVAYADDLLLIVEAMNRAELEKLGTEWLRRVVGWGERVGVDVSKKKTVTMLLKGWLSANRCPNIRMNNAMVKSVKVVKYLGVSVSERMIFKPHLMRKAKFSMLWAV